MSLSLSMCIDLSRDRFSSNLWKPLVRILEFTLEAHQHNSHICVLLFFFSELLHFLQNKKKPLLKIHSAVSLYVHQIFLHRSSSNLWRLLVSMIFRNTLEAPPQWLHCCFSIQNFFNSGKPKKTKERKKNLLKFLMLSVYMHQIFLLNWRSKFVHVIFVSK